MGEGVPHRRKQRLINHRSASCDQQKEQPLYFTWDVVTLISKDHGSQTAARVFQSLHGRMTV
jgi:hypothetical protein